MRRIFPWTFTIADVQMPILGADFLTRYNLAVIMSKKTLQDTLTSLSVVGTPCAFISTGISAATAYSKEYLDMLNEYQELVHPPTHTHTHGS